MTYEEYTTLIKAKFDEVQSKANFDVEGYKTITGFSQTTFQRHLGINHAADIGRPKVYGEILVASYDIEGVKSNTPLFNNQKGLNL